jgi:hypothetical protein
VSSDGAMIKAHNQIRVNLRLSAVRFLRSFAAIPYQYED